MTSIDESPYKKWVYTEIYCICSQTIASIGKCLLQCQRLVAFYDTYIVTYNNLATQAVRRMVPSAWPTQRDNKIDRELRTRHELNNRASNLVERKHKINGCYTVLEQLCAIIIGLCVWQTLVSWLHNATNGLPIYYTILILVKL